MGLGGGWGSELQDFSPAGTTRTTSKIHDQPDLGCLAANFRLHRRFPAGGWFHGEIIGAVKAPEAEAAGPVRRSGRPGGQLVPEQALEREILLIGLECVILY